MDDFTFKLNKIAGAVLGTCLVGMGIGIVAQEIYYPKPPKKPGYALPEEKEGGEGAKKGPSLPALLAKADPKKGEADAKICAGCHSLEEGGGTKIGPALYGVVDREKGSVSGFDYSAGLKKKGGKWTFADLNEFLTKPSAYIQGTKMGYQGEESPEKRAEIIAYLRTLSKKPVELPKVSEEDKKVAEGGGKKNDKGGDKKEGGGDSFVKLVAAADPKKGESDAGVCSGCHSLKKGGGNMVGPELYGVVDREKGTFKGYDYSAGVKKKGGKWTYDDLNQFLTKPAAYIQGTKMGYQGEANEKKRAAIVAYLRTLSDSPAPLPKAGEGEKKAEGGKPAEGDKKAEGEKKADAGKPAEGDKKPEGEKKAESDKPAEGDKKPEGEKKADDAKPAEGEKKAEGGEGGGDIAKQIASADPKKGESAAQICSACHSLKKGGGNMVGPELYGVVERDKGTFKGYDYSDGMKKKGGKWTYADLNQFLNKPSAYVQGTKMGYQGEPNEKKRFEIIAYLRTLSDSPAPLPGGDKK